MRGVQKKIIKTLHIKLLLLYNCVYIQSISMIHDHGLYIEYTCDYEAIIALCCIY
jgi:hypothetical protein